MNINPEVFERLVKAQESLLEEAKKRNELLAQHTNDFVVVEEKRTVAIDRLTNIVGEVFEVKT